MKSYKTIRLSEDTYQELLSYRAELEQINKTSISFNDAIDLLFGEVAGMEYELAAEKLRYRKSGTRSSRELQDLTETRQ